MKKRTVLRELAGAVGDVEDFSRSRTLADVTWLLAANASGGDFERVSTSLARGLLDACEEVLVEAPPSEGAAASIARLFDMAERWVRDRGPEATAWLTVVRLEGDRAVVGWAGGDEVWLIREGRVLERTRGHSLRRRPGMERAPDVLTRGLGAGYEGSTYEVTEAPWRLEPGSALLLLSHAVIRRVTEDDLLAAARAHDAGALRQLMRAPSLQTEPAAFVALVDETLDA